MATSILEAFVVTFALQSKGFKDGAKEVEDTSKRVKESTGKAFGAIEEAGKRTAKGVRSLSSELLGMFLAFQGGSSITSFIGNMVSSTASADRFGQTVGMTTAKIYAWRQAMKEMGGSPAEADSGLQAMEKLKQAWITGQLGGDQAQLLQSLGINQKDLQNLAPGGLLTKLAGAPKPLGDERYANQLQQLGLSQSMIYFLMQGQGKVEASIKAYEGNTKEIEKQAKEAEELQKKMAALNDSVTKLLVPALNRLLPPLTTIADWLAKWLGAGTSGKKEAPKSWRDSIDEAAARLAGGSPQDYDKKYGGPVGSSLDFGARLSAANLRKRGSAVGSSGPNVSGGQTRADRNRNPGNIVDGSFARSQPGYAGSDGRFAKFATAQHGAAAQLALLLKYVAGGRDTIASIIAKWAPPSENDTEGYIRQVEKFSHIRRGAHLGFDQLKLVAQAMARVEGFHSNGGTTINGGITINTRATDAQGVARDLPSALRQRGIVVQADQRVRP